MKARATLENMYHVLSLPPRERPPTPENDKVMPPIPSNWFHVRKPEPAPKQSFPSHVLPQRLPMIKEVKDLASTCPGFQQLKQKSANDGC